MTDFLLLRHGWTVIKNGHQLVLLLPVTPLLSYSFPVQPAGFGFTLRGKYAKDIKGKQCLLSDLYNVYVFDGDPFLCLVSATHSFSSIYPHRGIEY